MHFDLVVPFSSCAWVAFRTVGHWLLLPFFTLRELLFFSFKHVVQRLKTLFPSLPHVLNPCFKLRQHLWIEAVQVLLCAFFHHH